MSRKSRSSRKETFNLDFGSSEPPEPPRRGTKRKAINKLAPLDGVPPEKRPMDTQKHNEGVSTKFSCPEKEEEARLNLIRGDDIEDSRDESPQFGVSAALGNQVVRHSQRCVGNMLEIEVEEEEDDDLVEPAIDQGGTKKDRAVLPPMLQEKWRKHQHAFRLRRQAADGDESAKRRLARLNKGKSVKEQIDEIESELVDLDKFTHGYKKLFKEKKTECSSSSTASRKSKKKGKGNAKSCQKSRLNDQLDLVHLMKLEANFRLATLKSDRQFNKGFVQSTVTHHKEAEVQVDVSDDETDRSISEDSVNSSEFVVDSSEIHGHLGLTEMKAKLALIYVGRLTLQKKIDTWIDGSAWDPINGGRFRNLLKLKSEKDIAYFKWKKKLKKFRETIGFRNFMRPTGSDGVSNIDDQSDLVFFVKPLAQNGDQFPGENGEPIREYWGRNDTETTADPGSNGYQIGIINANNDLLSIDQFINSNDDFLAIYEQMPQPPAPVLQPTEIRNFPQENQIDGAPSSIDGALNQEFSGSVGFEALSAALESLSRLSPRTLDGIIDIAIKDFTSPAPPNLLEPGQDEVRSQEESLESDITIKVGQSNDHDKHGSDFFLENKESGDQEIGAEETVGDGNLEPGDEDALIDSGKQPL